MKEDNAGTGRRESNTEKVKEANADLTMLAQGEPLSSSGVPPPGGNSQEERVLMMRWLGR